MKTGLERHAVASFCLAALTWLPACSALPDLRSDPNTSVSGRMLHSPETFTGTSTASVDGSGALILKSNHGAYCSGPYTQQQDDNTGEIVPGGGTPIPGQSGVATLNCRDGRSGSVLFLVGEEQAVGTGMLGKDIVTLTIGGN